jgi:hypothetical protein
MPDGLMTLPVAQETFQTVVECAGPAKNKIDDYSAGRFIAKPLQRNLRTVRSFVSRLIPNVTSDDKACHNIVKNRLVKVWKHIQLPFQCNLWVTLGFTFCETIMANTLPEAPILIGTRTEDQREGLRDIDSIFPLLDFFLDMEGNDLPQKEIMTP